MLLGDIKLNVSVNKQFAEKSVPVKVGDKIALMGLRWINRPKLAFKDNNATVRFSLM
ncbi:MAG TPA: hypothetical protein VJ733_06870 [Candidatus Binatia bacterium]|nr:hypothetical protein [Candidatus Binatia bacterium]